MEPAARCAAADVSARAYATHGSPWRYDTFVPVVFAGGGLTARRVDRTIETVDIAPTVAAIVGAKPPSGSRSGPLQEVLQGFAK